MNSSDEIESLGRSSAETLDESTVVQRPKILIIPVYSLAQLDNAKHTATLGAERGFVPVIVCNSAKVALALANDAYSLSVGRNTGFGGAARVVAATHPFGALILCNDDLRFTEAGMSNLADSIANVSTDDAIVMGFLPQSDARISSLPNIFGVLTRVSGLSALHHGRQNAPVQSAPADVRLSRAPRTLYGTDGFPFVCVVITRPAWDQLEGIDARFPLYFEDTDFLFRAHRSGIVRVCVACGECSHDHSATAREVLEYIVPLMCAGARNYLVFHCGLSRKAAGAVIAMALLVRIIVWAPLRPNRRMEVRAAMRALGSLATDRPTPMPPWN
jgi:GT2 family glycosyltransferase